MLTDSALKQLKGKAKPCKVSNRDGMYAYVPPTGTISFRYDYRLNGRRETLVIGKFGRNGISLAAAREMCLDARRLVREGQSPAQERQREKQRLREANSFGQFAEKCLAHEDGHSSRGVYNKAEYEVQRRQMLQEWADLVDSWVRGEKRIPTLFPMNTTLHAADPTI